MEKDISIRKISRLAWPDMISQGAIVLVGIIDLMFIARLGTFAIASVAMANIVCLVVYNFVEGFRTGTTVLTARYLGQGKREDVTGIFNAGLVLALCVGLVVLMFVYPLSKGVYALIGDEQIRRVGVSYLTIRLCAVPFLLIQFVIVGLFRGLQDTVTPALVTFSVAVMNALLDYGFIYGKWGLPAMGVKGAAIATFFAEVMGMFSSCFFLFKKPTVQYYLNFRQAFKPLVRVYVRVALEIGLYTGPIVLALSLFVYFFSIMGQQALAAHQIAYQIFLFVYFPTMGFMVASSILAGRLVGARKITLIPNVVFNSGITAFIFTSCFSLFFFIFARNIAHFFSPLDIQVALLATQALKLACVALVFDSLYLVIRGILTGIGDTRFILWLGLVTAYLIFLPLAYLLGIMLNFGIIGGYVALLIWSLIDPAVFFIRYLYLRRHNFFFFD